MSRFGVQAKTGGGGWLLLALAATLLTGCESSGQISPLDRLSGEIPRPAKVTDARENLDGLVFPNLASVPSAPPTTSRQGRASTLAALEADRQAKPGSGGGASQDLSQQRHLADIYFGHGSTRLDPQDRRVLGEVAKLQRETGRTLRIVGHASGQASAAEGEEATLANFRISLARAESVAEALVRLGIDRRLLLVEAQSNRQLIYRESTAAGAAGNRRVEIFQDIESPSS